MPGFWIYRGPEYTRGLNMPLVLNLLVLWIYQCSKYASCSQYNSVQNIAGLYNICQGYTGFWIYLNNSWLCLDISPGYIWVCLNMLKYTWICLNLPKFFFFFFFFFTFSHCNPLSAWTGDYLFQRLHET